MCKTEKHVVIILMDNYDVIIWSGDIVEGECIDEGIKHGILVRYVRKH